MAFTTGFLHGTANGMNERADRNLRERMLKERPTTGGFLPEMQTAPDAGRPMRPMRPDMDDDANAQNVQSGGLLALMDKHEGGGNYDTLFSHAQSNDTPFQGVRVSDMTIGELSDFASPSGKYGQWVKGKLAESGQRARVATPMGRFQIVGTTLRNTADAMGLPPSTRFDRDTQRKMATHLARNRLAGQKTMAGKLQAMRSEWEGFKHVPDNQLAQAISNFERDGGRL